MVTKEDDMNLTLEGNQRPLAHGPEHAPLQRNRHRLLDRHRALLPADRLHRLRATAPAAGGGGVHPPRLPRLLPGGTRVGQAPRRGAAACAGADAAQGVGVRRLRHHPRLCAHRPLLGGRWPRGLGLCGGHQRALGALVSSSGAAWRQVSAPGRSRPRPRSRRATRRARRT